MWGTIYGQDVGYRKMSDGVDELSLNMHFRNITANAALALVSHHKKGVFAESGFSSVLSHEGGIEDHNPGEARVVRHGVGFLTFRTAVSDGAYVHSRWDISFWTTDLAQAHAAPPVGEMEITAVFLGYDRDTGKVHYKHEVRTEKGASDNSEGRCSADQSEVRVRSLWPERRLEVIEAPKSFLPTQGAAYRIDPTSREIELTAPPMTFAAATPFHSLG